LKPGCTIPPFRVLAPDPSAFFSRSTTARPRRASAAAAVTPVYPPPTMTTSASVGRLARVDWSRGVASHQYGSSR
jgi:hypothetical protein